MHTCMHNYITHACTSSSCARIKKTGHACTCTKKPYSYIARVGQYHNKEITVRVLLRVFLFLSRLEAASACMQVYSAIYSYNHTSRLTIVSREDMQKKQAVRDERVSSRVNYFNTRSSSEICTRSK